MGKYFSLFMFVILFQELKKLGLGGEVDLHVYEVPVEYQTVQSLVPSLWKQYHPQVRGQHVTCSQPDLLVLTQVLGLRKCK